MVNIFKLSKLNKKMHSSSKRVYLRKISDVAILGGMSAFIITGLVACNDSKSSDTQKEITAKKGATVTLQEQDDGSYKILEEIPSSETRVIVKDKEGNERMLGKEEVDELVAEEAKKVDDGSSSLLSGGGAGLGIGGAILASAAGALIGSYIGNKLFNNQNYRQNAQRNYASPQAYQRSASNFNRPAGGANQGLNRATPSNARSGFFGGGSGGSASATS